MTTTQGHEFSQHAFKRGQQRGIRPDTARFVMDRADIDVNVGNGCHALRISRKELCWLKKDGFPAAMLERCLDVVLVHDPETGTVVTALHDIGKNGRRYRKQLKTRKMDWRN